MQHKSGTAMIRCDSILQSTQGLASKSAQRSREHVDPVITFHLCRNICDWANAQHPSRSAQISGFPLVQKASCQRATHGLQNWRTLKAGLSVGKSWHCRNRL